MKKKTLIICSRRTKSAPRLYNIYHTLNVKYDIFIAGDSKPEYLPKNKFKDISSKDKFLSRFKKSLALISYFSLYPIKFSHLKFVLKPNAFALFKKLEIEKFEIVVLHHIDLLPIIHYLKLKHQFKLVLNIHEYYPREFDNQKSWISLKLFWEELCHKFMPSVDLFLSVNNTISSEYIKNFSLDKNKFIFFPNVKKFVSLKPINNFNHSIKLVHHGAAIPSRKIENMIKLMDFLPQNFELTLILLERNPEYYKYLKSFESQRINFLTPIDFDKIPEHLNCYDIGIYFLEPSNFNEENSLPNKFFEFIQARICLAITPLNEMSKIVLDNDLGFVSKNFNVKHFAQELSKISKEEILIFKKNVDKIAPKFSLKFYEEIILNEFEKLQFEHIFEK